MSDKRRYRAPAPNGRRLISDPDGKLLLHDGKRHRRQVGEAERARGRRRDIDDAAADKRPAIVYAHNYRATVAMVGHPYSRAKAQ